MSENAWTPWLKNEWQQPYFQTLAAYVRKAYAEKTVYPPKDQVFAAFANCPLDNIKVVIIGQDPYHEKGQAHGLCFSVNPGVSIPPSLLNIYRELADDLRCFIPDNGCLLPWARQGVFLLNAILTVEDGHALSHQGIGWETFTDHAISLVNVKREPVVFMLWGRNARAKGALIDRGRHLVLEAAHPSPLSAYNGFFGCRHFSKANAFLKEKGRGEIDWQIDNLFAKGSAYQRNDE